MATLRVSGFELMDQQFNKMGRPMIKKIVEAGAMAAKQEMIDDTMEKGHVRTGDMLKSIGTNEYREFLGGGSVDVYPQENDRKGVRNATKAYVINYGKGRRPSTKQGGRNRTGDKFITGNEAKTEQLVREAMQEESDRLIDELNGQ